MGRTKYRSDPGRERSFGSDSIRRTGPNNAGTPVTTGHARTGIQRNQAPVRIIAVRDRDMAAQKVEHARALQAAIDGLGVVDAGRRNARVRRARADAPFRRCGAC